MAGVPGLEGDAPIRAPMSWTGEPLAGFTSGTPYRPIAPNAAQNNAQTQAADPNSLLNFYKAIIALRNRYPALAQGDYQAAWGQGSAIAFQRRFGRQTVLVAINYGAEAVVAEMQKPSTGKHWRPVYPAGAMALADNKTASAQLRLPAQSVQVFVGR